MAKIILNCKDEEFNDDKIAVEITFINQRMSNMFAELVGEIKKLTFLKELREKLLQDKADVVMDKELSQEERKAKFDELDEKFKEADREFVKQCNVDIIHKRQELLQMIFKANHVQNESLLDPEFWANYVEPGEINEFITACITKDVKKKA